VRIIKTEMMTDDPFAELRDFVNRSLYESSLMMRPPVSPAVPLRLDGSPAVPFNNAPVASPDETAREIGEGQRGGRGGIGGFGGQPGGFGGQPGGGGFGGGQPGGGVGGQFGAG